MESSGPFTLVLMTAPDLETARSLVRGALETRLIACANLVPQIESHYWWQERIEHSPEVLVLMKTSADHLEDLERHLLANHPYDTPEILAVPLHSGTPRYLAWLASSLSQPS